MITVHHLSTSRSERIVWLLEELGVAYEMAFFQRESNGAAPASLKEVHPLGRAPVITDGDAVIAESGAIVEYIVHRHGGGRLAVPPHSSDYPRYIYWMHFAEGSLMSLMLIALMLSRIPEAAESPVKARIWDRVAKMFAFLDGELAGREYFVGKDFTAADVMMLFPFTTMSRFLKVDLSPYPNLLAYRERLESRPAYQKAMSVAGPNITRQ